MFSDGMLLRIYISESARIQDRPAYKYLTEYFMDHGFPGCTVFRGMMGYGHEKKLRTVDVFRLSLDLPVVIDVVDTEERIMSVVPEIEKMVEYGLIITEKVQLIRKSP
jgi:PII-like signaling protein